jgi:plasmid maintenance system antidote protein VapI
MALRLKKAFGISVDMLLKLQAGYDAAPARMHGDKIKVKRFKPDHARL